MMKSIKVRLFPTRKQEELMWKACGVMRYVYNWALERQMENFNLGNKFISSFTLKKEFTKFKNIEENKWLKDYSSQMCGQAIIDLCEAYAKFFKKQLQKGYVKYSSKKIAKFKKLNKKLTTYEMNGHPKFKSKKKCIPSFYVRYDSLKPTETTLNFEKIGRIKIEPNQIPLNVKLYNPRCSFDGKYWYLSVSVECDEKQITVNKDLSIGVDLGIKELAVLSNGDICKNINKSYKMKKLNKKLKRLQKQLSRKYEMNKDGKKYIKTKNIIKLEKQIKLLHRRIANINQNHRHHLTSDIIKLRPYRVVIEDLNVKGMMKNRHLSRAIGEQGFYEIRRQLEYKCKWNGIELVIADRFFPSSKKCSCCGHIKKNLKLSDRTYICEECGLIIDRDLNASINLANYNL